MKRLFISRPWLRRMRTATAAAAGVVAVLGVVAGLYVSGPKYVRSYGPTVPILCLDGRMANFVWEPAPAGFCENKRNGTYRTRSEFIRHTTAWERIKSSVVGSTLTVSTQRGRPSLPASERSHERRRRGGHSTVRGVKESV